MIFISLSLLLVVSLRQYGAFISTRRRANNVVTTSRDMDINVTTAATTMLHGTVKPVRNDHLYNKIYYMWFIQ